MTVCWWHRYIGKDFTFGLLDIGNIVISIIVTSNVILGILLYRGLLCRGPTVYLNCIIRGALEFTKTIMCKPQVQNSDYHLPSTLTLDPYPWPLPVTLTLDPRPSPLTCDPYPWPLPLTLTLTLDTYPWPLTRVLATPSSEGHCKNRWSKLNGIPPKGIPAVKWHLQNKNFCWKYFKLYTWQRQRHAFHARRNGFFGGNFLFRISELTQRERIYVHFGNYRFSFRKLQILISQTADSHFANYRFSFRKLQIPISQTTDSHFANYRFPFRKLQISISFRKLQ